MVGGDAFQAADGDGFVFDTAASAGGLARAVAGTTENSWEYVGLPVDHVRVGVRPWLIMRIYSGTGVWAGQAHWQSTTR